MKKRKQTLPVPTYIYKWLRYRIGYTEALEVQGPLFTEVMPAPSTVYNHFSQRAEGMANICVYGYYPNRGKLYNLHLTLKSMFNSDMLSYTRSATEFGKPAKTALEDFLRKCRIEEDDMQIATAYKRWQRMGDMAFPGLKIY